MTRAIHIPTPAASSMRRDNGVSAAARMSGAGARARARTPMPSL